MVSKVWVSGVKSNSSLGNKPGLRWKLFGENWSAAQHIIIDNGGETYVDGMHKSNRGYALERSCFPEALAVWNRKCFARVGDFFWAYGFVAVKGRLAEVLKRFDLGEGSLIPLPIYKEDLITPEPGEFFLVNFGARKDNLVADQSRMLRELYVDPANGKQVWTVNFGVTDDDVALSPKALEGPDLWNEESIRSDIFMSDALVSAIYDAGVRTDLRLTRCRIVDAT